MSVMATTVVKELGIMRLVAGSETYKTASRVVTQALGLINERMNSETLMQDVAATLENKHLNGDLDVDIGNPSLCDPIMAGQMDALVSESDTDADDDCERGL
ncbi:unnamed protein product [Sphagnum troendelagicum]|uniref:Uncharacterized protein n=1 Tax=Sphagnum troendelagicum TaxID=128251 RepID=A0ABP0TKT2_9BRYO